jgi:hypothetical protein
MLEENGMRSPSEVAAEIRRAWKKVNYAAAPYLDAMDALASVDSDFGLDSGREIIARFLSNASYWKGDDARRIKSELKRMLETDE